MNIQNVIVLLVFALNSCFLFFLYPVTGEPASERGVRKLLKLSISIPDPTFSQVNPISLKPHTRHSHARVSLFLLLLLISFIRSVTENPASKRGVRKLFKLKMGLRSSYVQRTVEISSGFANGKGHCTRNVMLRHNKVIDPSKAHFVRQPCIINHRNTRYYP